MSKKSKNKFYAVRKGYKTGIFNSWNECKNYISGYSGAIFKGFATYEEAELFLKPDDEIFIPNDSKILEIFIDGSYDESLQKYSYGIVILTPTPIEISKSFDNQLFLQHRNVAGEILGALAVFDWIYKNNPEYDVFYVYYDYAGIKSWVDGSWLAKTPLSQLYQNISKEVLSKYTILFRKVAAHSGNKYNDLADKLAKNALQKSSSDISFDFFDFQYDINILNLTGNKYTKYSIIEDDISNIKNLLIDTCEKNNLNWLEEERDEKYIRYMSCISYKRYPKHRITITQFQNNKGKCNLHIQGKNYSFYDILCETIENNLDVDFRIVAARMSDATDENTFNKLINLISKVNNDIAITNEVENRLSECYNLFNKNQLIKLKSAFSLINLNLLSQDYSHAISALCKSSESLMKNIFVKYEWASISEVDHYTWKWAGKVFSIPRSRYDSIKLLKPYTTYKNADVLSKCLEDIYKYVLIKYRNTNSHGKVNEEIIDFVKANNIYDCIIKFMNKLGKVCNQIDNFNEYHV